MRLFNKLTSRGPESTAFKILDEVVKLFEALPANNPNGKKKFSTDDITNQGKLIETLGKAISEVIDYPAYKKLPDKGKENLRKAIAKELFREAENNEEYKSQYKKVSGSGAPTQNGEEQGLSFSTDEEAVERAGGGTFKPYATAVNFPEELFLNQKLLQNSISQVVSKVSPNLHREVELADRSKLKKE